MIHKLEYERVCNQRAMLIGGIARYKSMLILAMHPDRYLLEQRRELTRLVNLLEDVKEEAIHLGFPVDAGVKQ